MSLDRRLVGDKRLEFRAAFSAKYKFKLPMAYHPSDATVNLLRRVHQRRPTDFIPLKKVLSLAGDKNTKFEPAKINIWRGAELVLERENGGGVKRNNAFYLF